MKKYTYIDLFAGAGGLSLGFDRAGFKNLFSVEFDKTYANTYIQNFPDHKMIIDDIKPKTVCAIIVAYSFLLIPSAKIRFPLVFL